MAAIDALLPDPIGVPLRFRRLQVVEQSADLLQGSLSQLVVHLSSALGNVTAVNGVVQVVLTFDNRCSRHLDKAGEVQRVETTEALADLTRCRCGGCAKLIAKAPSAASGLMSVRL